MSKTRWINLDRYSTFLEGSSYSLSSFLEKWPFEENTIQHMEATVRNCTQFRMPRAYSSSEELKTTRSHEEEGKGAGFPKYRLPKTMKTGPAPMSNTKVARKAVSSNLQSHGYSCGIPFLHICRELQRLKWKQTVYLSKLIKHSRKSTPAVIEGKWGIEFQCLKTL